MRPLFVLPMLPLLFASVVTAHAGAPAPECRGMLATIVGNPNSDAPMGTEGDDVIVTNGGALVSALGGNDTICVTNGGLPSVSAGAGDDVVDASASPAATTVSLGDGNDTYFGNRGVDNVRADGSEGSDTIYTGGGPDHVWSGVRSEPRNNTIDLGGGNDIVELMGTLTGTLAGGAGRDQFRLTEVADPKGEWRFDNVRGLATHGPGNVVARFAGMESFALAELRNSSLVFLGSSRADSLTVSTGRYGDGVDPRGSVRARMGGGADHLAVDGELALDIAGGSDRDKLTYRASPSTIKSDTPLRMDLRTGTVASKGTVVSRYESFEDASLKAPSRSTLVGTQGPNRLWLLACRGRVDGLGGDDRISALSAGDCVFPGSIRPGVDFYGGTGDDRVSGHNGHDRLIGGPGDDAAAGGRGSDFCRAERRSWCER